MSTVAVSGARLRQGGRLRQVIVGLLLGAMVAVPALPELLSSQPATADPNRSSAIAPAIQIALPTATITR